jgi:TolC family type I secretion outer membrane protein
VQTHRLRIRRWLGAGASLIALAAVASPAGAQSLAQSLVLAYQNNPRILAARDRLRSVDEQIAQAISLFRPSVNLQLGAGAATSKTWTKSEIPGVSGIRGTRTTPAETVLTITQPIFRGGSEYAEVRRAESLIRAERGRLFAAEQDVFIEVVRAYMNVVRDEAILRLRINNVAVLRRQLQAVRDRFEVGEVTRTDVAQAEASVARAEAERALAGANLEISRAAFTNLVGRRPGRLVEPRLALVLPAQLPLAIEIARSNHPAVVTAFFEEYAARSAVDSITGELLPQISLNGTLSQTHDRSGPDSKTNSASLTATVTVPLYESGATYSRARAAKQIVFQRGNELAQSRRTVEELTTRAWDTLLASRASVSAFQAEVRANEIALEGVRQENQAGLRTVLDVLDAEQRLLNSQVNLVGARRDVVVAAYEVIASIGRLTAIELRLPVPIYDATSYYRAIKFLPFGLGPSIGKPPTGP